MAKRMLLLKLLRPGKIPQRRTQWNWRVKCYYFILTRKMSIYRRCAVCDVIQVGEIQIVHAIRDYWFEQELQRFHIDTAQHLAKVDSPTPSKRPWGLSCLFHWKESMIIYAHGKSYSVSHADTFTIQTDMSGFLKVSTDKDFILRSEYIVKHGKNESFYDSQSGSMPSMLQERHVQRGGKTKPKITVKDKVPTELPITNSHPIHSAPEIPQKTTQYRGFEENDIF